MTTAERLANAQLVRMRAMTGMYHRQFFLDIRWTLGLGLLALAGAITLDGRLYLLVPVISLVGAVQTAFDASYLIFARHYAARLERWLNQQAGAEVLVAARLEDTYLFPLGTRKVVTLAAGRGFTWFGFMTAFYTLLGIGVYAVGMLAGLPHLDGGAATAYVASLGGLTMLSLAVGAWWFVGGVGERRLREVFDDSPFAG